MFRLDRIILETAFKNTDYFKNVNPNHVTFISLILNVVIYYLLHNERNNNINLLLKGILIIRWFTDCLDGFIARKYKKISKFGKKFDKFTDLILVMIMIHYFTKNRYLSFIYLFIDYLMYDDNIDKFFLLDLIENNSIIIFSLLILLI